MKIIVVGIGKDNHNYRKIEGFFDAFSQVGEVEWLQQDWIYTCKHQSYDLVFGEISFSYLFNNIEKFKSLNIKSIVTWVTADINKLVEFSLTKRETKFVNLYKSNLFNKKILKEYKKIYGDTYQQTLDEGIAVEDFLNLQDKKITDNLSIDYLPCSLSKLGKTEEKIYDVCYFGTINNRPIVREIINDLKKKYRVFTNFSDVDSVLKPEECFSLYSKSKLTISEQVYPVPLEYPVRLGESSANGCKCFIHSSFDIKDSQNPLIPDHIISNDKKKLIEEIDQFLESYTDDYAKKMIDNFSATYENAANFILRKAI